MEERIVLYLRLATEAALNAPTANKAIIEPGSGTGTGLIYLSKIQIFCTVESRYSSGVAERDRFSLI